MKARDGDLFLSRKSESRSLVKMQHVLKLQCIMDYPLWASVGGENSEPVPVSAPGNISHDVTTSLISPSFLYLDFPDMYFHIVDTVQ